MKLFSERVNVGAANVPEQEHSDPQVEQCAQNAQLWLHPNAQEFTNWSIAPLYPLRIQGQQIKPCLEELWIR